jgi:WhiB family redox-sensing transcriptional regulator
VNTPFDPHLPPALHWHEMALCRETDPDLFFPERERGASTSGVIRQAKQAKSVCSKCPVQARCLQDALDRNERNGIWAGVNFGQPLERRKASAQEATWKAS